MFIVKPHCLLSEFQQKIMYHSIVININLFLNKFLDFKLMLFLKILWEAAIFMLFKTVYKTNILLLK